MNNQNNFNQYVDEGLIKKVDFQKIIFEKYYENSLESLRVANNLFQNKTSFLWVIVISYYSMFYIASAYIYKKGYKANHQIVHKVINDALIFLAKEELELKFFKEYNEEKDKALSIAEQLLDDFQYERAKRSSFQYEMNKELKESKAKTSLNRAKNFVEVFRELLLKK
jgi:uncharacterized protein (UPF0332 family)